MNSPSPFLLKKLRNTYINRKTIEVNSSRLKTHIAPADLAAKMRASYYLLGALLGRTNHAEVALPGDSEWRR